MKNPCNKCKRKNDEKNMCLKACGRLTGFLRKQYWEKVKRG